MLKIELKAALIVLGTACLPLVAHADQPMNSSVKAQQQPAYVSGESIKTGDLPAAYNASASYQCVDGWDVFITADYIYWNWQQESMQMGVLDPEDQGAHEAVFQYPGYASGFQVGLGFNMPGMDNWNLYSEYTWYKNSNTKSVSSTAAVPLNVLNLHGRTKTYVVGTTTSEVEMQFDALDFLVRRPFYFGKKLTANVSLGLKALWITQNFNRTLVGSELLNDELEALNSSSAVKQTTWGLGPKIGIETNWILGCGFQIMGNLSTSVLSTSYNVTGTLETLDGSDSFNCLHNYGVLRPVTEAFLGLGWNTGFCDNSYRLALSVGYDFDVYWSYNLIDYAVENRKNVGDMYLQGLNIGARFDF